MPRQRRIMRRFKLSEISAVDVPAQEHAKMTLLKRRVTKTISGRKFFASDFAYVGDEDDPTTWKFLLCEKANGQPTKKMVDKAVAAVKNIMMDGMPNRYHIPDDALDSMLDKIRDAWSKAYPNRTNSQMPEEIQDPMADPAAAAGTTGTAPPAEEDKEFAPPDEEEDPEVAAAAEEGGEGDEEVDPAASEEEDEEEKFPPKGAVGKILKRYIDPFEGAKSFPEVMAAYKEEERYSQVMQVAWPVISALDTSLRSIIADKSLDDASKHTMMRGSVEGFLAAIKESWPEVEEAMEKALDATEGEDVMKHLRKKLRDTDGDDAVKKQLAALSKQVGELTGKVAKAEKERDDALAAATLAKSVGELRGDERKFYDSLKSDDDKAAFLKMDTKGRKAAIAKSADDDETIELEGETIRKSAVGEHSFRVLKAQAARMARLEKQAEEEREARLIAEYTVQAEEEMGHLPGTVTVKAKVLRAIDENIEDDEVRNALAKMLSCGDKAVSAAYDRIGTNRAIEDSEHVEKRGIHPFEKAVSEIKSRDRCSHMKAMQQAREEFPDEFEDWQADGGQQAS